MHVASVVSEVLASSKLDPDVLDYLASGIEVENGSVMDLDELVDFVAPQLEEYAGEEQSKALARALHARLSAALGGPAQGPDVPRKLEKAVCLQDQVQDKPSLAALGLEDPDFRLAYVEQKAMFWQVGERPVAKAAAKEAKLQQKKNERTAAVNAELSSEVEERRERAVEIRAEQGLNFNAALKLGPFDLPHPAGGRALIEDVALSLARGRRYALIGRNGQGKSTLLKNLAARRVGGISDVVAVHYVSQDVSFSASAMEQAPVQVVLEGDAERSMLLKKVATLEGKTGAGENAELRRCLDQLTSIGAETAEFRASKLLVDLGFSDELKNRKLKALSGGWRVRVALAAALFAKPDVLMLDEPTNHLSMQAVLWLAHELSHGQVWKDRIIMIVSHNRYFIDSTCTDTLHICGVARRMTHHRCDYTTFFRARGEQQRAREKNAHTRAKTAAKLKDYINSGQAAAGNVSSGSRRKELKKLEEAAEIEKEELAALEDDADLPLVLHVGGDLSSAAVQFFDVGFRYPSGEKTLFQHCGVHPDEFLINSRSRIVLVGENGNGKTTLVKLIVGELEATEGEIVRDRGARFALVNQHHADQLDLSMTPMQFMKHKFPGSGSDAWEAGLADHLDKCGVRFHQMDVVASALSGGQRSRVALAAVSFARPHVLILDEPTNNLDLSSIEVLAEAIEKFEGGVVLVSHDQHFVSRLAKETWVVGDNAVRLAESFDAYRAQILACAVPDSDLAHEAVEAHIQKKLELSGGAISRVDLAKEKQRLLGH